MRSDQRASEVLLFCEVATSIQKKNCYIKSYLSNSERSSQFKWINARFLSKMMKKTRSFSYDECRFQDDKRKNYKPRVALATELKIRTSLSFKSSFVGFNMNENIGHHPPSKDCKPFNQMDLQSLGADFGYALLEYTLSLWKLYKRNLYEVKEDMEITQVSEPSKPSKRGMIKQIII